MCTSTQCERDSQFWDPVYQQCYNLSCGFLYQNTIDGDCRYRNITLLDKSGTLEAQPTNQVSSSNSNCTLVKLEAHEVRSALCFY